MTAPDQFLLVRACARCAIIGDNDAAPPKLSAVTRGVSPSETNSGSEHTYALSSGLIYGLS